jgi:hypothetical protein
MQPEHELEVSVMELERVQVEVPEFQVPPMAPHDAESLMMMLIPLACTTDTAPNVAIIARDNRLTKRVTPRVDLLFEEYKIFATQHPSRA